MLRVNTLGPKQNGSNLCRGHFQMHFFLMKMFKFRLNFHWSLFLQVYKCFNGLNPDYLNNLFKQPCQKYELRDSHRLEQPKFNTFTYGLRSFRYYGSKLWNVLPFSVKNTKELHVFNKNITEWCHSTQCRSLDVFWHSDCIDFCFLPHFSTLSLLCAVFDFNSSPIANAMKNSSGLWDLAIL